VTKFPLLLLLAALSYPDQAAKWRADYDARLKAPTGWLSVAGLTWLHEGANKVCESESCDVVLPKQSNKFTGTLRFDKGVVVWEPASGAKQTLKPDDPGPADVVTLGRLTFAIVNRGTKTGVRLRDPEASTRRNFTGTKWFPPAESWRVKAKWVASPQPKKIQITNILGMKSDEPSPGYAEFTVKGRTMRLDALVEDNELFFMFRDATSAHETYGGGRFLYADMPRDGAVELDFNKAHNPPCVFTAYATCPLPPRQNTLPIAVEAGEKRYGSH